MLYRIESKQNLPISIEKAWDFISSPANLQLITPDHMKFNILQPFDAGAEMYAGMIIEYTVRPVLNIPLHWVTEITQVNRPHYFIDEQRKGPYRFWHHKHFLKEIPGGVEMQDIVHYDLPFSFLGSMMHTLFVKKQLKGIFAYREKKLKELFGEFPATI